uniref:uncharacterized protein LOC120327125 n=1 Tax=Styela clava TaxID=7725 RepID=UPI0019396D2F|nr:uncharacterized protein LOC120327125 [Styela clava]
MIELSRTKIPRNVFDPPKNSLLHHHLSPFQEVRPVTSRDQYEHKKTAFHGSLPGTPTHSFRRQAPSPDHMFSFKTEEIKAYNNERQSPSQVNGYIRHPLTAQPRNRSLGLQGSPTPYNEETNRRRSVASSHSYYEIPRSVRDSNPHLTPTHTKMVELRKPSAEELAFEIAKEKKSHHIKPGYIDLRAHSKRIRDLFSSRRRATSDSENIRIHKKPPITPERSSLERVQETQRQAQQMEPLDLSSKGKKTGPNITPSMLEVPIPSRAQHLSPTHLIASSLSATHLSPRYSTGCIPAWGIPPPSPRKRQRADLGSEEETDDVLTVSCGDEYDVSQTWSSSPNSFDMAHNVTSPERMLSGRSFPKLGRFKNGTASPTLSPAFRGYIVNDVKSSERSYSSSSVPSSPSHVMPAKWRIKRMQKLHASMESVDLLSRDPMTSQDDYIISCSNELPTQSSTESDHVPMETQKVELISTPTGEESDDSDVTIDVTGVSPQMESAETMQTNVIATHTDDYNNNKVKNSNLKKSSSMSSLEMTSQTAADVINNPKSPNRVKLLEILNRKRFSFLIASSYHNCDVMEKSIVGGHLSNSKHALSAPPSACASPVN